MEFRFSKCRFFAYGEPILFFLKQSHAFGPGFLKHGNAALILPMKFYLSSFVLKPLKSHPDDWCTRNMTSWMYMCMIHYCKSKHALGQCWTLIQLKKWVRVNQQRHLNDSKTRQITDGQKTTDHFICTLWLSLSPHNISTVQWRSQSTPYRRQLSYQPPKQWQRWLREQNPSIELPAYYYLYNPLKHPSDVFTDNGVCSYDILCPWL